MFLAITTILSAYVVLPSVQRISHAVYCQWLCLQQTCKVDHILQVEGKGHLGSSWVAEKRVELRTSGFAARSASHSTPLVMFPVILESTSAAMACFIFTFLLQHLVILGAL